ncbi:hypothetical protein Cni_G02663 [Canna indica]|uniref:Uncharacterized protein n=1 Tax=Canna indica TaxID=4628 RepID=A0AAQ3JRM8_9LILI|nr:hypothetical protein Cni_G02663 [Canna indica]
MRALVCLLAVELLLSVPMLSGGAAAAEAPVAAAMGASSSRERLMVERKLDSFCESKRRVPKGPDPIHNRRANDKSIKIVRSIFESYGVKDLKLMDVSLNAKRVAKMLCNSSSIFPKDVKAKYDFKSFWSHAPIAKGSNA